ncbi:MAG: MBL fold metallo-hydrolase, partial [Deltaproteobacteria bacterium]
MQEIDFGPIRFIPGPNRGKYPHCHSLFIPGDGILIDPGADRRRLQRLREENQVREIWLSHWHEDHWMHLDLFDDLPLRLHPADAPPLASLDAFLDAYGISNPALRRDFARTLETRFHFRRRLPRADLGDGLTLSL